MQDIPSFRLPEVRRRTTTAPPTKMLEVWLQVLMWNPTVSPGNPEQCSRRLGVTLGSNGRVTARSTGTRDGMDIELEMVSNPDGTRSVRFPFSLDWF
jgi:hypothetical protein